MSSQVRGIPDEATRHVVYVTCRFFCILQRRENFIWLFLLLLLLEHLYWYMDSLDFKDMYRLNGMSWTSGKAFKLLS